MAFTVPNFVSAGSGSNDWDYDAWPLVVALMNGANAGQLQGFKNRLINGDFLINQRQASSNADDTYCLDRWYVLTQTGTVAVTQLTNPENGAASGVRLTQSQASAQRMGLAQIIESANCRDLRAAVATLAGRVRLSSSADVRYAVLEWTGTADTVTSDVVADWTSSSYTAGGFFNSTTLNVLAVGEVACTAATWRDLTALNATLGSSANNIIVFVWTEGTVAQNVTLDLNRVQFEPGSVASVFEHLPYEVELARCQRYYHRFSSADALYTPYFMAEADSTTMAKGTFPLPVEMRVVPTMTQSGAFLWSSGGSAGAASISAATLTRKMIDLWASGSGMTAGRAVIVYNDNSLAAYLAFSAEL